jgi:hypothetical protein
MKFTAYEFLCAIEAGLTLFGVDEDKNPEFVGKSHNWKRYGQLIHWFEELGTLPWLQPKCLE